MSATRSRRVWNGLAALAVLGLGACGRDLTPQITSEVQRLTATAPPSAMPADVWADVQRFYEGRLHAPQWLRDGDHERALAAARLIRRAPDHGLVTSDYAHVELLKLLSSEETLEQSLGDDPARIARTDVRITSALLALGHDVAVGRTSPAAIDRRWKAARAIPDLVGTLGAAGDSRKIEGWLDTVRPVHPEYAALQSALAGLQRQLGVAAAGDARVQRLALNLERWRWLPDDLGARHILVNIPAFEMAVRENGRPALQMKVVVGTPQRETPVFSATMDTIVFSPYWNVPDSIAEGETAPAAARDPRFLSRNNIEILRRGDGGAAVVDPSSVDWDDPDAIKSLAFRQKPGPGNALGHVKFLFPNPYDVYLHDTPADALFARSGRAFSHGCVRLEKPEALASYLLRGDGKWDEARIQSAMHQGEEQHVAMKEKLPVHIVYFTAWPDGQGGVRMWPDVYGLDAKQH
jgi:murein L,D-transpeptidase YcbB/YkuD